MINLQECYDISLRISKDYNLMAKAINYKSSIQREILIILTRQEELDIVNSILNVEVIKKLVDLARLKYKETEDEISLVCLAIASGVIIKEYEWGEYYLTTQGVCDLANMIEIK